MLFMLNMIGRMFIMVSVIEYVMIDLWVYIILWVIGSIGIFVLV